MSRTSDLPLGRARSSLANFPSKHRPTRFAAVEGQTRAIKELKAHVAAARSFHLILAGMSGTGKTTLSRIVAQSLFCHAPLDGEPCGQCRDCLIFDAGARHPAFHELSAAGSLGTKEDLRAFLDEDLAWTPVGYRYFVVFLDEVHRLTVHAQDMLLKRMEDLNARIIFIFALINPDQLPAQFTDRCRLIELGELTIDHKVAAIARVAEAELLEIEPAAAQLIAGQSTGLRSAIAGLQQAHEIAGAGVGITVDLVRSILYSEGSEAVVALFLAALAGDMPAALAANERMAVEPRHRLRDVLRLLQYLKATQIGPFFAPATAADRLLYDGAELSALVAALQKNAQLLTVSLPVYFDGLLEHWMQVPPITRETFTLHVSRFIDLCASLSAAEEASPAAVLASLPLIDEAYRSSSRRRAPAVRRQLQLRDAAAHDLFLTAEQARAVYEAATFLLQAYGVVFDAALPISFASVSIHTEADAAKLLTAVGRELAQRYKDWAGQALSDQPLHRLWHLTRDEHGDFHALYLFHLPSRFEMDARAWLDSWFIRFARKRGIPSAAPVLDYLHVNDSRDAVERHWRLVRRVWAGVDPRLKVDHLPLIDRLQVSPHRRARAGHITGARFHTSETISPVARKRAARDSLEHLSAWRSSRWDQLFTGWEMREHREREALRDLREQFTADITRRRSTAGDRLTHLHLDQLAADELRLRDIAPEARPRKRPIWPTQLTVEPRSATHV